MPFFTEIKKLIINFIWKEKTTQDSKNDPEQRQKSSEAITIPDFSLPYWSMVINTMRYWHENTFIDQGSRIEDHTSTCTWVLIKRLTLNIREETACSTNGVDQRTNFKRTKLYLYPSPLYKTELQMHQGTQHKTCYSEKVGKILELIGIGKGLLNKTLISKVSRPTIYK